MSRSDDGAVMTVTEVAAYLRVSERTVYRLIRDNSLQAWKVGRQYRIAGKALEAYLSQHSEEGLDNNGAADTEGEAVIRPGAGS